MTWTGPSKISGNLIRDFNRLRPPFIALELGTLDIPDFTRVQVNHIEAAKFTAVLAGISRETVFNHGQIYDYRP